ncbi:hypothetical protein ACCS96_52490, partial [Rhizobium ruizarguesonis]
KAGKQTQERQGQRHQRSPPAALRGGISKTQEMNGPGAISRPVSFFVHFQRMSRKSVQRFLEHDAEKCERFSDDIML